jgi:hypothetical protein
MCMSCDAIAYVALPDSDVIATIEQGRLVFTINGSQAIARIFPKLPSTVAFVRHAGDSVLSRRVKVGEDTVQVR